MVREWTAPSPGHKLTALLLATYMGLVDGEWYCFPGARRLSEETGYAESTIRSHLAELEAVGFLRREQAWRHSGKGGRSAGRLVFTLHERVTATEGTLPPEGVTAMGTEGLPRLEEGVTAMGTGITPYIEEVEELRRRTTPPPAANGLAIPSANGRGERLPDPFFITIGMRSWADAEGITIEEMRKITEEFCDYWRAVPGQRGRKADWTATWRNWLRRAQDDRRSTRPTNSTRPRRHAALYTED